MNSLVTENKDTVPGNMKSGEISGKITDGIIFPDVIPQVSGKNDDLADNMMATLRTSEIENATAGPSGIRPHMDKKSGKKRFACGLCHKEFSKSWNFDMHYRTHTGQKPFACEICQRKFSQKVNLDTHFRIHTNEKSFSCEICQRKFSRKFVLDTHYRTHTGEKPFSCEICQRKFSRKFVLDNHYRTHTGEKPFACEICQRKFSQKVILHKHYRTHSGEKPFVCKICQRKFTQKANLEAHYRTHTGLIKAGEDMVRVPLNMSNIEAPFINEKCLFESSMGVSTVVYRSESENIGGYKRNSRTTVFISEPNKDGSNAYSSDHEMPDEESESMLKESKCNPFNECKNISMESKEVYIKNDCLVSKIISESSHSLVKSDSSPGNIESSEISGNIIDGLVLPDVVPQVNSRNDGVDDSMVVIRHTSEIENAVAGPSGIQTRMDKKSGKKRFACGLCHKEFSKRWNFDMHYRTHTDQKPFACEICQRKFSQKTHLGTHYRTHIGEKPFECEICQRKFSRKEHLETHYRTHTGKKPFVCEICKWKFSHKCALENHCRTHTGRQSENNTGRVQRYQSLFEVGSEVWNNKNDEFSYDGVLFVSLNDSNLVAGPLDQNTDARWNPVVLLFVCPLCGISIRKKSNFVDHSRTHTGEKPYSCNKCRRKFVRKHNLTRHFWIHTGVKPYKCSECEKAFRDRRSCRKHCNNVHKKT
ncbi:unnamed protein product [Larinioides sclopetarius]|uniref:C2H2-type domain-containing protein n=1 Tax=Larinioides sclopetarius TaxID=280406 RepID=A0AAV2BFV1_9ARAC